MFPYYAINIKTEAERNRSLGMIIPPSARSVEVSPETYELLRADPGIPTSVSQNF